MTAICQKKNKGMRAWLRKNAVGYAFLMPFLVLFAIFVIVPVGVAMYYSLTNYNMIQAPKLEAKKAKADAKAAEEAKKTEAEAVLKKLLASGMSADEILEKLK